ncbi:MAG TPA: hypothetical protein DCG75_13295 [Bacteroidales bacterium]|nr:hypothetical protein [Bacteroidales bacterium]
MLRIVNLSQRAEKHPRLPDGQGFVLIFFETFLDPCLQQARSQKSGNINAKKVIDASLAH